MQYIQLSKYINRFIKTMTLMFLGMLLPNLAQAGFDFGECQGSGTFEQQIVHYDGNYENTTTVGTIPQGIQGLRIDLISTKDVDIRLYGANNDKIVHWPYGIHNQSTQKTKPYKNVPVVYSGYNGVGGERGHEFIEVDGSTPTVMTMKAFGYQAGYATVNYSWTGKDGCTPTPNGNGSFTQNIIKDGTTLVGTIPPEVKDVDIQLTSMKDLDIQLYGRDGTAIVSWKPKGLLSGATEQSILYHDMNITWSGYNGVGNNKGHEYIKITGLTKEVLVMKVYGYEAGTADVVYTWGTEEINGYKLPPEPDPAVNNATLLGVDSNGNGVRDDVERYVIIRYAQMNEFPKTKTAIALQYAWLGQKILENPTLETHEYAEDVLSCEFYWMESKTKNMLGYKAVQYHVKHRVYGDPQIKDKVYNTRERILRYITYNKALGGNILSDKKEDTVERCMFNIDELGE